MDMTDKIERIRRFLSVCDELIEGSYMNAEGKISEALKHIAGCRELTNLFAAVTDGYDYPAAKRAYLRPRTGSGTAGRVGAFLPSERQDVLAPERPAPALFLCGRKLYGKLFRVCWPHDQAVPRYCAGMLPGGR